MSFPVAIDSGSGDLDISGAGCDGCVTTPPNKAYSADASSTSSATFPFKFSNSYQTCDLKDPTAPCTISGKLFEDQASLAGAGPVSVKFGSITEQTTNFDQFKEIDGVMGFTMGGEENVFSQLVSAGKVENVWAICMKAGSKSNGTLTIGGVDPRLVDGAGRTASSIAAAAGHAAMAARLAALEEAWRGRPRIAPAGTRTVLGRWTD